MTGQAGIDGGRTWRGMAAMLAALAVGASGCASPAPRPTGDFPIGRFEAWRDGDPVYRLLPGDTLALDVLTAPELSRETLVVAPDGRISAPFAGRILVADRTLEQAAGLIETALGRELRDPSVDLRGLSFGSQQIFVGGEVGDPGVYPLPGPIGVIEAVTLAGGFGRDARNRQVVVLRRSETGGLMLRVVDARTAFLSGGLADDVALQRFDIVFVPRTSISEVNQFVQQYFRDALPIQFGFFTDLSGGS